jgi:hypothetical protein
MDILALDPLSHWIEKNSGNLSLISIGLVLFVLFFFMKTNARLKKYRYLLKGNEAQNVEELLVNISEKTGIFQDKLAQLEDKFTSIQAFSGKHIQNWGLVRFKAFQNTGGDQSFALALLDGSGDGVVISSIFGREESRVYCKPVSRGVSNYPLSQEEQEAINKALGEMKK